MCLNKVYVPDFVHLRRRGSYYPCGYCSACRQALANRRANKIRHHDPEGTTCYMITLSYENKFLPYILRSDIIKFRDRLLLACNLQSPYSNPLRFDTVSSFDRFQDVNSVSSFLCTIPVYRDWSVNRVFGSTVKGPSSLLNRSVGNIDLSDISLFDFPHNLSSFKPLPNGDIDGLLGVATIHTKRRFYDPDKISIAFTPDWQNFIKRLRINLFRSSPEMSQISYYYAPEYGPTTQRFHIHALIWFDSRLTSNQVKSHICKAWPFCSKAMLEPYIQVARCAAHYVASYVNCSSDLPKFKLKIAPLKSSHSLHFGFDSLLFGLSSFVNQFASTGYPLYTSTVLNSSGQFEKRDFFYPKYVNDYYCPKCKGYSRLNSDKIRSIYTNVDQYLDLGSVPVDFTKSGEPLYNTNVLDVYGIRLTMTIRERNHFVNSLLRTFSLFSSLGYTKYDTIEFIINYYTARYSQLYKQSFNTCMDKYKILNYYNLSDVYTSKIRAPTIEPYLDDKSFDDLDPNNLRFEVYQDNLLLDTFYKNIKLRKINQL